MMPMLSGVEGKEGVGVFSLNNLQPNVPAMPRKAKSGENQHESLDGGNCVMRGRGYSREQRQSPV